MRYRSTVVEPGDGMAHIAEIRARRVEIVRDRNAVQVVHRSVGVDDGSGCRVPQDWDCQRVGERDTDSGGGLACRILLVDLLDRYQQVLAVRMDAARRAVGEPDMV